MVKQQPNKGRNIVIHSAAWLTLIKLRKEVEEGISRRSHSKEVGEEGERQQKGKGKKEKKG